MIRLFTTAGEWVDFAVLESFDLMSKVVLELVSSIFDRYCCVSGCICYPPITTSPSTVFLISKNCSDGSAATMVCRCVSLRSFLTTSGVNVFGCRSETLFRAATAGEVAGPLLEVCRTVRKGELGSFAERVGENAP